MGDWRTKRSRGTAAGLMAPAMGVPGAGCGESDEERSGPRSEPAAGNWRTWVLSSPGAIRVPPPPRAGSAAARRDDQRLRAAEHERTASEERAEREFGADPAVKPWLERAMAFVAQRPKDPPAASRAYGLVSVAMADAAIAAFWRARAKEAADSRVYGGIHWPIDGVEGLRMGRRIGRLTVERAKRDGSER